MASYVDHFTEGADVALTSHTPDSGGSWTEVEDTSAGVAANIIAANDNVRVTADAGDARLLVRVSWTPAAATYDVGVTIGTYSGTNTDPSGVFGRYTSTASYYAIASYPGGATTDKKLLRVTAGPTRDVLASTDSGSASNDIIVLKMLTASKKMFLNGAEILSSADNTITAVGNAGMCWGNYTNVSTDNIQGATGGIRHDDFTLDDTSDPAGSSIVPILMRQYRARR